MEIGKIVKNGGSEKTETITKKLRVMDYVFSYNNEDLINAHVKYFLDQSEIMTFKDGKRDKVYYTPNINIEILGDDKNKKTYSFEFMINLGIDDLNKLSDKPNNINDYVIGGEMFFTDPYSEKTMWLDPYLKTTMYHATAEFLVAKLENNKMHFKVSLPEDGIFLWFIIDFN